MKRHAAAGNEPGQGRGALLRIDAVLELLVVTTMSSIGDGRGKRGAQRRPVAAVQLVGIAEIDARLLRFSLHGLDIHGGIPALLLDEKPAGVHRRRIEDPQHLAAERIGAEDPKGAHVATPRARRLFTTFPAPPSE